MLIKGHSAAPRLLNYWIAEGRTRLIEGLHKGTLPWNDSDDREIPAAEDPIEFVGGLNLRMRLGRPQVGIHVELQGADTRQQVFRHQQRRNEYRDRHRDNESNVTAKPTTRCLHDVSQSSALH